MKIVILGSGVIGLTSAIKLRKSGHDVTIWTAKFADQTNSAKAGAFWYPADYDWSPEDQITDSEKYDRWAVESFFELADLANIQNSGVGLRPVLALSKNKLCSAPSWSAYIPNFRVARTEEIINPKYRSGHVIENAPIMSPRKFLNFLIEVLREKNVHIIQRELYTFKESFEQFDIVVNCTGVEAKKICIDASLESVSGQLVIVKPQKGFNQVIFDKDDRKDKAYIIPIRDALVLGGTYYYNDEVENPDQVITDGIIARCEQLVPGLHIRQQDIVTVTKGFRAVRPSIKLKIEKIEGTNVIHNYGHGGSGFSLAFGCANEVVRMIESL